ncbi:hypothetical protein MAN88_49550 [Microcystis aeruginosa]|nr:hypothetical protein MAN88_49550 [Microcystis aeruginosa]
MKNLVIISFWCERSIKPLLHLLKQLQRIESGCLFDIVVVCNANSLGNIPDLPQLDSQKVKYLIRENTGFNIGAWDDGWRHLPPYDYYLFLQDDCFIGEHLTYAMSINTYSSQKLENLQLDHKEK